MHPTRTVAAGERRASAGCCNRRLLYLRVDVRKLVSWHIQPSNTDICVSKQHPAASLLSRHRLSESYSGQKQKEQIFICSFVPRIGATKCLRMFAVVFQYLHFDKSALNIKC